MPHFKRITLVLALCASLLSGLMSAAEQNTARPGANHELPPYDFAISNGLYATITIPKSYEKPVLVNDRKLKIKVDGFAKEIEGRVLWQREHQAPLAVLLLGLSARAKDDLSQVWTSYLYESGYHVLIFDSVFHPDFCKRAAQGASGHLVVEAELVGKIIEQFRNSSEAQGRITQIGLVGTSYGGTVALNCMRLAQQGKFPFVPDRVLAVSPPISLKYAAQFLDRCYTEDLPKFGLMDLLPLRGHEPVPAGSPVPFSDSMMRAGIGYVFHGDLENVVSRNLKLYGSQIPGLTIRDTKHCTFQDYEEMLAQKYWEAKTTTPLDLWSLGELNTLLQGASDKVRVVLAADDPLDDPTQVENIKNSVPAGVLTVLPHGGHLGFVGCKWTKARLASLFVD